MTVPAVVFENVIRRFGKTVALDAVSVEVAPGSVLGLIGRNGAGKTTALRLALGTLWPDAGRIRILGLDPVTNRIEVATRVALLSEESALYPWMTIAEIVRFTAALHPRWDKIVAGRLVKDLDLDPAKRIRELSRGTRAKVALVLAVSARPELLLLDDPTAGVDVGLVEDDETEPEALREFVPPLEDDGGRARDHHAVHALAKKKLLKDEACLDRLSETDIIGDEEVYARER